MSSIMPITAFASLAALALAAGCGGAAAVEEIPLGAPVTVETEDGRVIEGKLAEVTPDRIVVEAETGTRAGERRELVRAEVAEVRREGLGVGSLLSSAPEPVEVTVPTGTTVPVALETALSSAANSVEDPVSARTREAVLIDGIVVIPAGSELRGHVTSARASGKVKGRAALALRFTELNARGELHDIVSAPFVYEAGSTVGDDAAKIGIGAAAGAVIGGIAGGGRGAAVGSAIGGGAGTAVVVATPGDEVELASGTVLQLRLEEPLTLQVLRERT
jgi:hypothetical protein